MKKQFDNYKKGFELLDNDEKSTLDFIRVSKYNRKNVGVPARILNHWDKMELLLKKNPLGATYSFSLVEMFWIKLIQKLRAYNLPLEMIKQLKQEICSIPNADEFMVNHNSMISYFVSQYAELSKAQLEEMFKSAAVIALLNQLKPNILESIILDLIFNRVDYRILINEKGEVFFHNKGMLHDDGTSDLLHRFLNNTHLTISMFEIIRELIDDLGEEECSENLNMLTKDEALVLKLLKQEDVSKLEITFNNATKRAETIKVTQTNCIENLNRIQDLIVRNGYQDISLKTQNGQVVYCENTTKHKLDTK